jgi:HK97 family phage major capsid protein
MNWQKIMQEAKAKMEALLSKAKAESRAFTDEEKTAWDKAQVEFNNAKAMAEREVQLAAAAKDLGTPAEPVARVDIKPAPKWSGLGEMLQAVYKAAVTGHVDTRLVRNAASGANETVPADGGFLVEPEFMSGILKRAYEVAQIASRCVKNQIGKNRISLNYVKETSRATGSRMGGVRGYWVDEAGAPTASKPTWGQMEFKLKKLAALFYATDELLEDSDGLASFMNTAVAEEFAWLLDEAIMSGTGAGQPMGIASAACTVSAAKATGQAAATIVYENIVAMWARMWARSRANSAWFINQDCEPQLHTMAMVVGAGGVPVYMPAGGVSATPYATLMGRPVIPVEQCATLGTVGDIVLGDFSQYQLIDKGAPQAAESMHVLFTTAEKAFRWIYRVDGQPTWSAALTPANGTNTLSPFIRLATRA